MSINNEKISYGIVYLGGEELRILIKKTSLTGIIAELHNELLTNDIQDMFQILLESKTSIDVFLPDLKLTGEVQILQLNQGENALLIDFEFNHISYDTDKLLHRRNSYRENLNSLGNIIINRKKYSFQTKNASIDGLMIRIKETVVFDESDNIAIFSIKDLKLKGQCKIVWVEKTDSLTTFIGLQYIHLEKDDKQTIPAYQQ